MEKKTQKNANRILCWTATVVILFVLWIVCSGIFETKMLVLGAVSSVIAATVSINALTVKGIKSGSTYFIFGVNPVKFFFYILWLIKEIILAALDVSKVICFHRDQIDSAYCMFKADYDNPLARAALTDSITLTPGTITVKVDDEGVYTVHGLTDAAREGLLDGGMQRKVARTFGEEIDYQVITEKVTWPDAAVGEKIKSRKAKKVKKIPEK